MPFPRFRAIILAALVLFITGCGEPTSPPAATQDNQHIQGRGEGKDQWWEALPRPAWEEFSRLPSEQSWFEVYEIFESVYAIYEPGQFEEIISYLIVGEDRALLFDTGIGVGRISTVVSELTTLPIAVLNSHTHYDHVGSNYEFERIYGTSTEYTRAHTSGRAHQEISEFVGPGWIWKETPDGFAPETYHSRPFQITDFVQDGELIELGGISLEVLLTPGHAPDSLCLLDRANRRLWTGDTFYVASLYSHLEGSDFYQYQKTAQRLAALESEVDVLLPAHNEPVVDVSYLQLFSRAFAEIQLPDANYVLTDGQREYTFGDFSLLVSDPPPWSSDPASDPN